MYGKPSLHSRSYFARVWQQLLWGSLVALRSPIFCSYFAKHLIEANVIAATNRPDHLDPALLRSGRLDKKIYIWAPDDAAREELFRMYIEKSERPHEPLDYHELAILTTNYVSADIEAICDEVARDASRNLLELVDEAEQGILTEEDLEWHIITMDMLRETILETPSSLKMVDMSVYEKWLEKIG